MTQALQAVPELARISGRLERALAPETALALRQALAGINGYYSNLIEGASTEPIEAELALTTDRPENSDPQYDALLAQARAGIIASLSMDEALRDPANDPLSPEMIRFAHFVFCSNISSAALEVRGSDGRSSRVIPGQFRDEHVRVGEHIAPAPEDVPELISALPAFIGVHGPTIAAAMLAHHRLCWIHPFLDGNGRAVRLITDGLLHRTGAGGAGLWSLSRGLARNSGEYKSMLRHADAAPRGPYDGRGALSMKASEDFVRFMLDVALDQASFMDQRLSLRSMARRVERLCGDRADLMNRDERAAPVLLQAMVAGRVRRGDVAGLVGLSERRARDITRECLIDGLLVSPSEKGELQAGFPMWAMASLFPNLFPIDDPHAAMMEAVNVSESKPLSSSLPLVRAGVRRSIEAGSAILLKQ